MARTVSRNASGARGRVRWLLLAGTALVASATLLPQAAQAQSVWQSGSGDTTDYNNATNWSTSAVPGHSNSDAALFQSAGSSTIVVNSAVTPDSWTFDSTSQSYSVSAASSAATVTFSGAGVTNNAVGRSIDLGVIIAGSGGIVQNDTGIGGVLSLSAANAYTGGTTVSAGTLLLCGCATLGDTANSLIVSGGTLDLGGTSQTQNGGVTLSGGGSITNGTLTSSGTFGLQNGSVSAVLDGIGGVNKTTADTVTLLSANTYTGGTTVAAGLLNAAVAGALGDNGNSLVVSGGVLDLGGVTQTQNGGFTLSGGGTIQNGTLTSSGTFNLQNGTVNAVLDGSGAVSKTTSDTVTLSQANTYTGGTTITAGVLAIGDNSAIGTGTLTLDGGTLQAATSGLTVGNAVQINTTGGTIDTNSNTLALTGGITDGNGTGGALAVIGGGTLTLSGTSTYSGDTNVTSATLQGGSANAFSANSAVTLTSGTLDLNGFDQTIKSLAGDSSSFVTNNGSSAATLTAGDTANTTFIGTIQDGSSATLGLNKTGAGTLVLSGTNTYSGGTTVSAGMLSITNNAALGSGSVALSGGTTLQLDATFSNATTSSSLTNAITLVGNASIDVTSGNTAEISGTISEDSSSRTLTKTGIGTLVLSGTNSYTGGTVVSAGTLSMTNNGALGSGSVTLGGGTTLQLDATFSNTLTGTTLTNSITLVGDASIDVTSGNTAEISGVISEDSSARALTKTNDGTLILSGVNTYSGGTTVVAGTLMLSGSGTLGSTSGSVTVGGTGTLDLGGTSQIQNGGVTLSGGTIQNGTLTSSGTFNLQSGSVNSDAVLDGSGAVSKTTSGTVTLSGANTYTGGTTLSAGVLAIGNSSALGTGTLTFDGGTLQAAAAGLTVGNAVQVNTTGGTIDANSTTLALSGGITDGNGSGGALTVTGGGTLTLSGTSTYSGDTNVNGTTLQGGSANAFSANSAVTLTGATIDLNGFNQTIKSLAGDSSSVVTNFGSTAAILTAGGTADTIFAGVIQDGGAAIGLTKTGTGQLTLSGFNSYSGATNVQGGTLFIATATALPSSTDVTVSTGATLKLGDGFSFNINTLSDGTGGSGSVPASVVIGTTDSTTLLSITGGTGTKTFSGQITGAGSLSYSGGGTLVLAGTGSSIGGSLNVGSFSSPGTTGGLTITGSLNSAGTTTVLDGTLTVSDGGTLTSGSTAIVSGATGAAPTVTVTGTGSTWNVAGGLSIGDVFGTATSTVTVADGGTLKITTNNLLNIGADGVLNIGTGARAGTVDVPGIQNDGQIVANFDTTTNVNLSAGISGGGTLTKDGTGKLTLSGVNSYSGDTTVSGGTLELTNTSSLGTGNLIMGNSTTLLIQSSFGSVSNNVVLTGTVTFDVTSATSGPAAGIPITIEADGAITGTGILKKTGDSTLVLTSTSNNYSGGTIISAGTVQVTNNSSVGTGTVTLDGGTFQAGAAGLNIANAFAVNTTGGTVDTNGNTLTLSGAISNGSGAGALTKEGAGTLILTNTNTYSGGTTINNGTLQIGDNTNTGAIVGAVTNNSILTFLKSNNSGITTLDNNGGTVNFRNATSGGSMVLTNTGGNVSFSNTATAGNMTLNNTALGQVTFGGTSTAGNATISNVGAGISFNSSSTAGNATITNGNGSTGAQVTFSSTSTAGSATITNVNANSFVLFTGRSTGGSANLINSASGGVVDFSATTGANNDRKVTAGSLGGGGAFYLGLNELTLTGSGSTAISGVISDCGSGTSCTTPGTGGSLVVSGIATLTASNTYTGGTTVNGGNLTIGDSTHTGAILGALSNSGTVEFVNANLSGMTTITNSGALNFRNTMSAGNVTITNNGGGTYNFYDHSTAGNANITLNGGIPAFHDFSTAGNATITINGGIPQWLDNSTAGNANITINSGIPQWTGNSTAGNATITINGGIPQWLNNSTAGNATITINGGIVQFLGNSTGSAAAFTNNSILDFSGTTGPNNDNRVSAGSIAGAGSLSIGANEITVGGNNLSTTYSGGIDGTGGSLVKVGSGALMLSGTGSYTGVTTVSAGTLFVTGSIAGSGVTIASGASLGGTGSVSSITVASGGILAPGLTSAPGTLHVQGSLTLSSGSTYLVQAGPQQIFSLTTATGAAALTGSNAGVTFASGFYKAGTYAILTANGGLGGTQFASFNTLGLSSTSGIRNPHLTYDTNDVFLVLDQSGFNPFAGNGNANSVGNAITTYLNNGGTLPPGFLNLFNLSGGNLVTALNSLTGEAATGGQQAAFQSTNAFFGVLFGQIVGGGGFGGGTGGGATGFAAEQSVLPDEVALAYASVLKAPASQSAGFTQRWSVWGSAYGGYNRTTGDTTAGTHDLTARAYGFAAGANYRLNATTTLGFALAGGGTNWGVADGLGSGRGDSLQASVYGIRRFDQTYVAAALAFGNHWMSTDRFATGGDHLTSSFNAQSYGVRLEGGHRYTVADMGVTPYAAIQTQLFRTPSYSESDLSGGGFGLSFAAHTATATRGELGARFDKSMAAKPDMQWVLSGKLAWAHDWNSDPTATAIFQALPGASFVVNGVSPAKDSALVSVGSELRMKNGISLLAKFDGEFASRSTTYTGTGTVRYTW